MKFKNIHLDSFGRPPNHENKFKLIAMKGDDVLGYVTYTLFRDNIHIDMIEVTEDHQRKGIGTALWRELIRLWPEAEFPRGYCTDEGSALRLSLKDIWAKRRAERKRAKSKKPRKNPRAGSNLVLGVSLLGALGYMARKFLKKSR